MTSLSRLSEDDINITREWGGRTRTTTTLQNIRTRGVTKTVPEQKHCGYGSYCKGRPNSYFANHANGRVCIDYRYHKSQNLGIVTHTWNRNYAIVQLLTYTSEQALWAPLICRHNRKRKALYHVARYLWFLLSEVLKDIVSKLKWCWWGEYRLHVTRKLFITVKAAEYPCSSYMSYNMLQLLRYILIKSKLWWCARDIENPAIPGSARAKTLEHTWENSRKVIIQQHMSTGVLKWLYIGGSVNSYLREPRGTESTMGLIHLAGQPSETNEYTPAHTP